MDRNGLIRSSANNFVKTYGPLTKRKATDLLRGLEAGTVQLNDGMTAEEGKEVLTIAASMSMAYLGEKYDTGSWEKNPDIGKSMMESELIKSPETIRKVASLSQSPAYLEKAKVMGIIDNPRDPSDTTQSFTEQAGGDNASFNERGGYENDANTGYTLSPTASGGGYQRVSGMNADPKRPTEASAQVTMSADGRGGTFRGKLGNGDSRQIKTTPTQGNSAV